MRRTSSLAARCAVLLLVGVLAACSDTGEPTAAPQGDPLIEQLVAMGAQRDQIADRGDHFVVEGDIVIYKKDLRGVQPNDGKAHPAGPLYQRYHSTVGTNNRIIRVDLAPVDAENASWAAAARAAMSNWNSAGSHIFLVEGSPADITVSMVNQSQLNTSCTAASGAWPVNGAPGSTVSISRTHAGSYGYAQQVWVMTHELGHNFGLHHTDQSFGTQIPNTPTSDPASVMNSGDAFGGCPPAAPSWSGFSSYDITAVRYLYPHPRAVLTVSNSGGYPLLSWSPIPGAVSYSVELLKTFTEKYNRTTSSWTDYYAVGSTTGTSLLDSARPYTGKWYCTVTYSLTHSTTTRYHYKITTHYSNGYSVAAPVEAPVAPC
jgi:hypothetical protein